MKKFILGFVSALLLTLVPAVAFALSPLSYTYFDDIPEDSWYYTAATELRYMDVLDGYDDNTFRGEENITRGQLAKIVYNTYELLATDGELQAAEYKIEQLSEKLSTLELGGDCYYEDQWYTAEDLIEEDDWFPVYCGEDGFVETRMN
jgi:hypothetical protein